MSLQFSNPHNFQYFILFFHHPYLKYSTFYERVVNIQEKLEYSTDIISKTKVLDKYLQAMTKPVSRHYLIQFHIIKLNLHVSHQGHINSHPNLTIHTIYQHFVATNLTVEFQLKSNKKFRANISQFTTHNTNKTSVGLQKCVINNDLSSYVLHDDKDGKKFIQYNPNIQVFCHHSNNCPKIIWEACGLPGYPASKCFTRGFGFLPRDIQRRISAYNTNYGDTPSTDTSRQDYHKQVLPAPTIKIPTDYSIKSMTLGTDIANNNDPQATIQKLQHDLPENVEDIESKHDANIDFINMTEMDTHLSSVSSVICHKRYMYPQNNLLNALIHYQLKY